MKENRYTGKGLSGVRYDKRRGKYYEKEDNVDSQIKNKEENWARRMIRKIMQLGKEGEGKNRKVELS